MIRDDLAGDAVYFALFRVVEIAELHGSDKAVEWAQQALELPELRAGMVERVKESRAAPSRA